MGLLTPGHWQSNHWPSNHWVDDHWPNYGDVVVTTPPERTMEISVENRTLAIQSENRTMEIPL